MTEKLRKTFKMLAVLILAATLAFACFALAACNREEERTEFYLTSYRYDADTDTVTAVVGLSGDEEERTGVYPDVVSYSEANGIWFSLITTEITVDADELYAVCDAMTSQDERTSDGITYSQLKVEFDYVTLYKSVTSGGRMSVSGRNYIHTFDLDGGINTVALMRRTQNSATWYSVLLASALSLAIILFAVSLAAKKKNINKQ